MKPSKPTLNIPGSRFGSILYLIACCTLLSAFTSCAGSNDPNEEEWIFPFNGEDLDGWDIKIAGYDLNDNFGNTFRVEDGKIVVRYDQYDTFDGRFGHLFLNGDYSHYRLSLDYRFVGEQAPGGAGWALRNSGIMTHGQPAATMAKDQSFPSSLEVQLLGGNGERPRTTGNLCTPGTHVVIADTLNTRHCINSTSETYHGDQWVTVDVLVLGDSLIQHFINGQMVIAYSKPQWGGGQGGEYGVEGSPVDHGSISLQSESHPVEFRNLKILNLKGCMDPEAGNYKAYYVESENAACVY